MRNTSYIIFNRHYSNVTLFAEGLPGSALHLFVEPRYGLPALECTSKQQETAEGPTFLTFPS